MKLKDKVAIITGASRGIGKNIAKKIAKEGAEVVLVSRSKKELERTLEEIKQEGGKGILIPTDISKKQDVSNLLKQVIENYSKVDILVNSTAIITPIGPLNKINIEEWENTIKNNLFGTLYCIKQTMSHMIERNYGKIVNLSGGGAFKPFPNFSAYAVSKAAIIRLTETVAEELRDYNITINAISPGAIKTQMTSIVLENKSEAGEEYYNAKKVFDTGGASLKKVEDLALFLVSDESKGLSGKTISAVWDDLDYIKNNISKVQQSDRFTLRRID